MSPAERAMQEASKRFERAMGGEPPIRWSEVVAVVLAFSSVIVAAIVMAVGIWTSGCWLVQKSAALFGWMRGVL